MNTETTASFSIILVMLCNYNIFIPLFFALQKLIYSTGTNVIDITLF